MRHIKYIGYSLIVLLFFLPLSSNAVEKNNHNALIIGNSSYSGTPLDEGILSDTKLFSQALEKIGFHVTYLSDVTYKEIKNGLKKFSEFQDSSGVVLFLFSGYGVQSKGENYLVPVDSVIEGDEDLTDGLFPMDGVVDVMSKFNQSQKIFILDFGYQPKILMKNVHHRSFTMARMEASSGSLIASSTSPGSVADVRLGGNNSYVNLLLKHLVVPGLPVEQVFKRVRIDVDKLTSGKQIPWEATSLTREVVLNVEGLISVNNELNGDVATSRVKKQLNLGRFISFGTGSILGNYYPSGGAIAAIVNKYKNEFGFQCSVESTAGSADNIESIVANTKEFGIAQSDYLTQAYGGIGRWKKIGPQREVRSVFGLFPDVISILVRDDSNIHSLNDLKGKKMNGGSKGPQHNLINKVLHRAGFDPGKDIELTNIEFLKAANLVRQGKLDAAIAVTSYPSHLIKRASLGKEKLRMLPVTGMDRLLNKEHYLMQVEVDSSVYPDLANSGTVESLGIMNVFITGISVPDDVVYNITKSVFENHSELRRMHPVLSKITKEQMLQSLAVPIHPGAMKYYTEVGME